MVKDNIMEIDAIQISHVSENKRKSRQPSTAAIVEPTVEKAVDLAPNEIIAELEEKLLQARARRTAITGERKGISLAAFMGSTEDRARLDTLNQEGAILSGEIESIEIAIAEAQASVAAAKNTAAIEAERQKRQAVVQRADELRGHAQKIDDLWRQSIAEYVVLQDKLHQIVQSGVGRPSRHQVQAACRRALISAFIGSPLQLELLAPPERHTVAHLVEAWARNVDAWASRAIDMPPTINGREAA
jgi:hypothetical protein